MNYCDAIILAEKISLSPRSSSCVTSDSPERERERNMPMIMILESISIAEENEDDSFPPCFLSSSLAHPHLHPRHDQHAQEDVQLHPRPPRHQLGEGEGTLADGLVTKLSVFTAFCSSNDSVVNVMKQ